METKTVKLELPWPPSVNRIWKTTSQGGWYSTKEAKNYRQVVCYMAGAAGVQGSFTAAQHVHFTMYVFPPDNRRRDLDNLAKCVLDALQDARVYSNDSQIKVLHMEMLEARKGGSISVVLTG